MGRRSNGRYTRERNSQRNQRGFCYSQVLGTSVDEPGIYTQVRSGDFLADTQIAWRDAYEMQMRAAVRPLQQAAE
jgi:hypothetical protein